MKNLLFMAILGLTLLLTGCARYVVTNTTNFYKPDYHSKGKVSVVAADSKVDGSLEFAHYKSRFEAKLANIGYQIVAQPNDADYLALVSYGIDSGKTSQVSTPIYGQTGGGTTYKSGTVYSGGQTASYSGSTYTMPSYGIVGMTSGSHTTYQRAIALDIVEAKSFLQGKPVVLLESRAKSRGSCNQIVEVFDEILEAMFNEFPGENGRAKKIRVTSNANC